MNAHKHIENPRTKYFLIVLIVVSAWKRGCKQSLSAHLCISKGCREANKTNVAIRLPGDVPYETEAQNKTAGGLPYDHMQGHDHLQNRYAWQLAMV